MVRFLPKALVVSLGCVPAYTTPPQTTNTQVAMAAPTPAAVYAPVPTPVAPAVGAPPAGVRYVVVLGPIANNDTAADPLLPTLRRVLLQELRGRPTMLVREERFEAQDVPMAQAHHLAMYGLQGGVNELHIRYRHHRLKVRAEVNLVMVAEPQHAILGMLSARAETEGPRGAPDSPEERQRLSALVVESAASGALGGLDAELASRAR
ncbi:MAG: hypothetical protein HY909_30255 [Deltaproteobacteria bacterium]|nr:hypothetical protein [Deltaproteobacteria bacterium]